MLAFSTFGYVIAHAQTPQDIVSSNVALPNAPLPEQSTTASANNDSKPAATASISGTILDTNGAVLQGATVTLLTPMATPLKSVVSGANGQFSFSGLSSGVYRIRVTAPGVRTYNSNQIHLQPGEVDFMRPVRLVIAVHAIDVTVIGSKEALSIQQVKIAEQQRIGKVIPNFYTTYDWNAPPMLARQKFQLGFRSVIDPMSFIAVAGIAGAEQYLNVFPEFGGGFEGYAKRYGAAYTTHFTADMLSSAVYPSIFHQDPRYFYKGRGSFRSRALYAVSCAFITRGDNGHLEPNYSGILGNFTAAAISNLYYPDAERGGSLVLFNGLADTGADAALNLIREFILSSLTSRATKGVSGEPGE
ncbi:MAG TPA: carboxypeptidase-like regulatory domain-containing protein [Acidobacteriaceae bacterium]|nr:carboxypeptidase-like regulatory domain-containing protein [Acidobacteriaceae bacterium]